MNIAMIMSQNRIDQEHAMLNRFIVGLLNDGNHIVRIVPQTIDNIIPEHEQPVSLTHRIPTIMPVPFLLRGARRDKIVNQLKKLDIEVIVAFGNDALQIALDIHKEVNAPILSEIVSMREAKRLKRNSPIWRWFAPTPTIERTIAHRVGEERVALVPIGAATSNGHITATAKPKRCISILNGGDNVKTTKIILESLRQFPNIHIFIEHTGKQRHKVWKMIEQVEMLDRVTCLRGMDELRALITDSDLVLLPSSTMPLRTIVLEVMLACIPIVTTEIPGYDMLIDEETALIVEHNWDYSISRLLEDPVLAKQLGRASKNIIDKMYSSSAQIAAFEASFTLI